MPPSTRDAIASALLREARTASCAAVGTAPVAVRPADTAPTVSCPTAGTVAAHSPEWFRATAREREIASARLVFVREIERLSAVVKKEGAIRHLVEASRTRSLSPVLIDLINSATACRRGGALSRRSLYRWASDYAAGGEVALLPTMSRTMPLPTWMQEFLAHYQKPQHPPVSQAYDDFAAALRRRGETPPSVYAVRRALAKMSTPAKEAGRATGNALLKLRPHRRRDTSELWPGDVYMADGTTFDAEVLHPLHGHPLPDLSARLRLALSLTSLRVWLTAKPPKSARAPLPKRGDPPAGRWCSSHAIMILWTGFAPTGYLIPPEPASAGRGGAFDARPSSWKYARQTGASGPCLSRITI